MIGAEKNRGLVIWPRTQKRGWGGYKREPRSVNVGFLLLSVVGLLISLKQYRSVDISRFIKDSFGEA